MLKVGITGGIGSGKTTICSIFNLFGVPVFSSDDEAKTIFVSSTAEIEKEFGTANMKQIADIVFKDKSKLEKLNSIIHPKVRARFDEWSREYEGKKKYVLMEAAILFESGGHTRMDKIITVTAPIELRIKRVMERNKISREAVLERMSHQWTDEERIAKSDFVIVNDGAPPMIHITKIHKALNEIK